MKTSLVFQILVATIILFGVNQLLSLRVIQLGQVIKAAGCLIIPSPICLVIINLAAFLQSTCKMKLGLSSILPEFK